MHIGKHINMSAYISKDTNPCMLFLSHYSTLRCILFTIVFTKLLTQVHHHLIFPMFKMKLTLYDRSRKEGVLLLWLNAGIRFLKA